MELVDFVCDLFRSLFLLRWFLSQIRFAVRAFPAAFSGRAVGVFPALWTVLGVDTLTPFQVIHGPQPFLTSFRFCMLW
jgi:hypothetical protein